MNANETGLDLSNVVFPDIMDVRTASLYLGIDPSRVKALIREEQLPAIKDDDGRYLIAKSDLDIRKANRATGSGGNRGAGKAFIVRIKPANLQGAKDALAQYGIELEPRYTYKQKSKAGKGKDKVASASSVDTSIADENMNELEA